MSLTTALEAVTGRGAARCRRRERRGAAVAQPQGRRRKHRRAARGGARAPASRDDRLAAPHEDVGARRSRPRGAGRRAAGGARHRRGAASSNVEGAATMALAIEGDEDLASRGRQRRHGAQPRRRALRGRASAGPGRQQALRRVTAAHRGAGRDRQRRGGRLQRGLAGGRGRRSWRRAANWPRPGASSPRASSTPAPTSAGGAGRNGQVTRDAEGRGRSLTAPPLGTLAADGAGLAPRTVRSLRSGRTRTLRTRSRRGP